MQRPPSGQCVFCGNTGPLTGEHAMQQWALQVLGLTDRSHVKAVIGRNILPKRRFRVVAHEALCENCNGVWLASYEGRFKRLMGATLGGFGPVTLNAADQEFAALWTVKSGLMLELAVRFWRPDGVAIPLPKSVFAWLHSYTSPPPGSAVWLGATGPQTGEEPRAGFFSNQLVENITAQGSVGNVITFVYGNLLLKTLIVEIPASGPFPPPVAPTIPQLLQIWPTVSDPVKWPPPPISYTQLDMPGFMFWPVTTGEMIPGYIPGAVWRPDWE